MGTSLLLTMLCVLADGCPAQPDYRLNCLYPVSADAVAWAALPVLAASPNVTDPNAQETWYRPVGKWQRDGLWCSKPGWTLVDVHDVDGTSQAAFTWSNELKTWTMTTNVRAGENWWLVRAVFRYNKDPTIEGAWTGWVSCFGVVEELGASFF
jgi:hypothetical protein